MTVLNIFSLDDIEQQNIIACLPQGKHVIGRGDLLNVTDKRVSRKHAVIDVSDDKITLTSVHVNPCFFKAFNGRNLTVISLNQENELSDGDQFALLPENYWFRVKIKKESTEDSPVNGKRPYERTLEENLDTKRTRLSTNSNESNITFAEDQPSTSRITNESHINNTSHSIKEEGDNEELNSSLHFQETAKDVDAHDSENTNPMIKEEVVDNNVQKDNDSHTSKQVSTEDIKDEPLEKMSSDNLQSVTETEIIVGAEQEENNQNDNDNTASASGSNSTNVERDKKNNPNKVRRDRCWYGNRCFRKNPNHRESFSHPGDEDYESDPDDDRPECPYGIACYRKNPEHRKEYKHISRPAPKPTHPPATHSPPHSPNPQNSPLIKQKRQRKATKKAKQGNEDTEDDYDYNDPFLNDGSSDDYLPSDGIDSSESDWEESQEADEESQERNRMLKEAKKFTKNKKKN